MDQGSHANMEQNFACTKINLNLQQTFRKVRSSKKLILQNWCTHLLILYNSHGVCLHSGKEKNNIESK
jgi:hypothetical protein